MKKNDSRAAVLILIVDDNTQNIQVLAKILEEAGYDLAVAMNGEEALEFLDRESPDMILLDVMMPGMDGFEVCRRIKRQEHCADIPVIFLTARGETDDIVKGFDAGGVDYVIKPFNNRELLARVKTHVELLRSRREISELQGIIPICSSCKKVRDDEGFWQLVEQYVETRSDATFSHSLCPNCADKLYGDKDWYRDAKNKKGQKKKEKKK